MEESVQFSLEKKNSVNVGTVPIETVLFGDSLYKLSISIL